jgi:hypothetical protein
MDQELTFAKFQCPKCAKSGCVEIRSWQIAVGSHMGLSLFCTVCSYVGIVDCREAKELNFCKAAKE